MINNFLAKLLISIKLFGLILQTNCDSEIVIQGITYSSNRDRLDASESVPNTGWRTNFYIYAYEALISPNNKFALVVHPSGNVILYFVQENHWAYGMILWQSNTAQLKWRANKPDDLSLRMGYGNYLFLTRMNGGSFRVPDDEIWRSNGITCPHTCGYGVGKMQDDGNFAFYDQYGNLVWGTMNNYGPPYLLPVDSYSDLTSDGTYKYLVVYIPHSGQSYEDAKANNQEWCLSAGMIDNDPNEHELDNDDHNLYWCDNYPQANQKCKCLGIKQENAVWSYYVNGKRYLLAFHPDDSGDGNEIQSDEYNLKGITTGTLENEYIFDWVNELICRRFPEWNQVERIWEYDYCCIEWDADVDIYRDTIDGTFKHGREAKLEEDNTYATGDKIEWKYTTPSPTPSPVVWEDFGPW